MSTATPHAEMGARIRSARCKKGMTQNSLSQTASVTVRHVIRLEQGMHYPSARTLLKISEATGQPLEFFRLEADQAGAA